MRATWDALASDPDAYVGDPARGREELDALFGRLGADPHGGTCIEVGSGPGRMTAGLAERFDRVLALDVSPAMLEQARKAIPDEHVEFRAISGERLDGVDDASADVVVCYLVLQHLPSRDVVLSYVAEFARVLKPGGHPAGAGADLDARPPTRIRAEAAEERVELLAAARRIPDVGVRVGRERIPRRPHVTRSHWA